MGERSKSLDTSLGTGLRIGVSSLAIIKRFELNVPPLLVESLKYFFYILAGLREVGHFFKCTGWLGREDSNLRSRDQNPLPCRLATPQ